MNNRNVYMHGFVCDDAALFLDTHPDCPHARHLYQENAGRGVGNVHRQFWTSFGI